MLESGSDEGLDHEQRATRMSKSFTIAVLPDTQKYAESYPEVFTCQTQWIAHNKDGLNIAFVLHEGDITNGNVDYQWRNASASMGVLDGVVPYAIVMGNHDMGVGGKCDSRESLFHTYFPVSRYQSLQTFGGVYEPGRLDSSYHLFTAGDIDWLVLAIEYLPRDPVLAWANQVVASYPDRRVIVLVHSYVFPDNTLYGSSADHEWDPGEYPIATGPGSVNNGVEMWDKFVRRHPTISFVFSGHFEAPGYGRMIGVGDKGNLVYQMLANYQALENGGNGYMRLVTCYADRGVVGVRTYSPYLDKYLTDSDNQFEFDHVDLGQPGL
jgi:hypothetical protein